MKAFVTILVLGLLSVWGFSLLVNPEGSRIRIPEAEQTQASFPEPTNYAVDTTGTLTHEELQVLNATLKDADNGKQQIAVVIVPTTAPLSIEEYGIKLAEAWKVGNKDTDNGAILIVATQDRKVRIEVGYGLEGDIPDAVAGRILDESVIPHLKQGDWFGGIMSGIQAIKSKVN